MTYTLRTRILPIEDYTLFIYSRFVAVLLIPEMKPSTYIVSLASASVSCMNRVNQRIFARLHEASFALALFDHGALV